MGEGNFSEYAVHHRIEAVLQEAMNIIEANDGKPFEVKKKEIISYLRSQKVPEIKATLTDCAVADIESPRTTDVFWDFGKVTVPGCDIVLRKVGSDDRDSYLELQRQYSAVKFMLSKNEYCDIVWNDHLDPNALTCTITKDGSYVGYCGIKNTTHPCWEIMIELFPQWTKRRIGYHAITAMLDAIKDRMGIQEFRIRIDPSNTASQKLFERLGAVPNGISEYLIYNPDDLAKCEEESLHLIDSRLVSLAAKFNVETRQLLSHILEYKLAWP